VSYDSFLRELTMRRRRKKKTGPGPLRPTPKTSASVAVILYDPGDGDEILLIRRAERRGDPWSGHISFPGGMVSPADRSFRDTAMRETAEEVGIDISREHAAFLGYMHEFRVRSREVLVVPCVFRMTIAPAVSLNHEATAHIWVPLSSLAREDARSTYVVHRSRRPRAVAEGKEEREELMFPSLVYHEFVIWGLTERILSTILGKAAPAAATPGERKVLSDVESY
jgi:8-oxo-dGTP pyrophosphatase MutT (NUDIX family)